MLIKFIKFGIVGTSGAIITFGLTWILTEKLGLWYMISVAIATIVAMISNFLFNNYWTFAVKTRTPSDADYDWFAYYNGNPIQKWWKQSITKTIWNWIPVSNSLVELGCGSSPTISKYPNALGIDINAEKIRFMQDKLPNNRFVINNSTRWLDNGIFSNVLCIEVLEHLKEPEIVISEISRILKNYGTVIIATPDYSKILWHIAEMFTPYKEEHCTKFTRDSLEQLCYKYNLKPIKHTYIAKCDLVEMFVKIQNE